MFAIRAIVFNISQKRDPELKSALNKLTLKLLFDIF